MITIYEHTVPCVDEWQRNSSYKALNTQGRGREVCVIDGPADIVQHFGADVAVLSDGNTWALRDVISIARRGDLGLLIAREAVQS